MKKIINILGIILLLFTIVSCSNVLENTSNNGLVKISFDSNSTDDSAMRTVFATEDANDDANTLTEIKLYGKLNSASLTLGSDDTLLCSWNSYSDLKLKPYAAELEAGTYSFMLTAKNYGATMTQTLTSKSIVSGSTTTLSFTSMAPSADSTQTGGIDITLYYNTSYVDSAFSKYVSYSSTPYPTLSVKLDDGETLSTSNYSDEVTGTDGSTIKFCNGNSYYINNCVSAGSHLLTYTFKAADDSVFVYPVVVQVKTGYKSCGYNYPFKSSSVSQSEVTSYTITYNENIETDSGTSTQTWYPGSSITDASAFEFENGSKRFKYWTTDAAGSGTKYNIGDTPTFTEDTTLYAQWGTFYKVSYILNLIDYKTLSYIQQFESGNSFMSYSDLTTNFSAASSKFSSYTFCGWDTSIDGTGTRYQEGTAPSISADTILYGQWCGKYTRGVYSGYYNVPDVSQWNALLGATWICGTDSITANIYIDGNIQSPYASLTHSKTFAGKIYCNSTYKISGLSSELFDTISSTAEISNLNISGILCKTNAGTIENVTVSGVSISGSGYLGSIAGTNTGTINNCTVSSVKVTGRGDYTGLMVGYNSGTISDGSVSGTLTGTGKYAGGFAAYNASTGTISGSGTVNITSLSGSDSTDSYYGYVIGYNDKGTVSQTITVTQAEKIQDNVSYSVPKSTTSSVYTITLTRTAKITLSVTDTSGDAAIYGAITSSDSTDPSDSSSSGLLKMTDKVDGATTEVKTDYLTKGTYYVRMRNKNILSASTGTYSVTID